MFKKETKVMRRSDRLRLPSKPVRLSKEELAGSRAGTLGCFPSPDLYEPEEVLTEEQLVLIKKHGGTHAKSGM